jgi:hypothetical protein
MTPRRKTSRPTRKQEHARLLRLARPRYEEMLEAQGGRCALCPNGPSETRRLDTDHDHKRMYVRGLLCHRCNRALPEHVDAEWLRRAAEYLERGDPGWASL